MEHIYSDTFQSENCRDTNITATFQVSSKKISDCNAEKSGSVTISDDNQGNKITITLKDFEKVLIIYDAFLAAKEATSHDREKLKQLGVEV